MKDRFIKKLKRSWLAIWIAFAAAALSTIGVMAAYTSVSSVKRVVSTQKGAGMLFSSNYLAIDENDLPRMITFSSMETSPCVTVNVCNYPQTMIKHKDTDITYTMTVELVDSNIRCRRGQTLQMYSGQVREKIRQPKIIAIGVHSN